MGETAPPLWPQPALDRSWQVTSELNGSELINRSLFNIAFERDPAGHTARIWVAASNGLHSFDGFVWHRYSKRDGLPSDFVRSVLVTRRGQLWVGTDRGAGTFDGKTFATHGSERGLAGPNVRRIVEDSEGALWFCSDSWPRASTQGGLARLRNGRWTSWHSRDGLPSDYVVNFFEDAAHHRFVVTLGGLVELRGGSWVDPLGNLVPPDTKWGSASIAESPEAGVLVATGFAAFNLKDGIWHAFSDVTRHRYGIAATRDGDILAAGSTGPNRKAFMSWTGSGWKRTSAEFPVIHNYVEDLRESPDGSIYAVGFDCLERWQRRPREWTQYLGVPNPQIAGLDGAVWFMDDTGFARKTRKAWQDLGKPFMQLAEARDGSIWGWDNERLARLNDQSRQLFSEAETGLKEYRSVILDAAANAWVLGLDPSGQERLVTFGTASRNWRVHDIPKESELVFGVPDSISGVWYLARMGPNSATGLVHFDREIRSYPVPPGLLSQYSNFMHVDKAGDVWLFGDTGLHRWRPRDGDSWKTIPHFQGSNVRAAIERDGELWFVMDGTTGGRSGLLLLAGNRWSEFEMEPILSSSLSRDGDLLFGSKASFYVVPRGRNNEPVPVNLPEDEDVISLAKTGDGVYWLGTPHGVFEFNPDLTPPRTQMLFSDAQVFEGEPYRARAQGYQRFAPAGRTAQFAYSWRVDEQPWSEFDPRRERSFVAARLPVGAHRLQVRSRDNAMLIDPVGASIEFQIHNLPMQEQRWFLPAITAIVLLLLGLITVAASAHWKLSRQARVLEQTVAERTAELLTDIGRREKVEHALRLSEERRRLATEAGGMGTWFWDVERAELISDERCRSLFGLTSHPNPTYLDFVNAIHPADRERARMQIGRALNSSSDFDLEFRVIHPDGSVAWIRANGKAEMDVSGISLRMPGILVDITGLKRYQEELEQANRVLQRSNEDLRQFAWAASHDLQEPLRMVVSYTQILARRYQDRLDEAGNQYIAFAVRGAQRMQTLLQALLEYWQVNQRTEREEVGPLDAGAALRKALGNLETAIAESGAAITWGDLPELEVSETALVQIFQNLIGNAIKYRSPERLPRVHVAAGQLEDGEWRFSVADNGIGIAPEHQQQVFGIFKRLNGNQQPGAGIGLAICAKVVENLGGRLWVESEVNCGSAFYFTIPAAKDHPWPKIPAADTRA